MREEDEGELCIAQNPLSSGRTKRFDVRYHFIRGFLKRYKVKIENALSERQHADTRAEPLGIGRFERHSDFLFKSRMKSEGLPSLES